MIFQMKDAIERRIEDTQVFLRPTAKKIMRWAGAGDHRHRRHAEAHLGERYEASTFRGLLDRATGKPFPKRAVVAVFKKALQLYRDESRETRKFAI